MNRKKIVNMLICLTNALSQPIMEKSAAVMEDERWLKIRSHGFTAVDKKRYERVRL